ncbi:MAG: hypothetical protein ACR2HM_02850 [Acidimicrobiales bacterium]
MRWRRCVAAAAAGALALVLALAGAGAASEGDELVTAPDPDVLVTADPNPVVARNSPDLAVNPIQATNMAIVHRVDRPDYDAGVHITNDGGLNWQAAPLQAPAATTGKLFAPSATYDSRGTLYVSFVVLSGTGNDPDSYWVARSGDGGLSFEEPARIAGPHTYQTTLAVAPRSGRLFASWLQSDLEATTCLLCFAKTGLPIVVRHSDDGGRTWSPPAQVSDAGRARVGAPALVVGPDGNPAVLYVDYGDDRWDWENLPGRYEGTFALVVARSGDRGERWEPGVVVDAGVVPTGRFLVYLPVTPGFAIGSNGDLYAAWADNRAGDPDILLRRSTDAGRTWREPVTVNRGAAGAGVPQDMPAVGVAPGGRVDVVYYDRTIDRQGSRADVLLSSSSDSGRSFSRTIRMSDAASDRTIGPEGSPHAPEADFGSRIAVASLAGGAIAAWTDTRNGTPTGGKQDIFTAQIALKDNSSVAWANMALAGAGILLGGAGVTLFVASRRSARRDAGDKVAT